jgi:all-trans-nonaprenyl-diphosphate synthase
LSKSYYKTASLMANSAKAVGVLSGESLQLNQELYAYGRCIGLAFQIVDDILDFTASADELGKPAGSDLKSGNLTAPVLFAMEETPYLRVLLERQLQESGDLEEALMLVHNSQGIVRSRQMAEQYSQQAVEHLAGIPQSEARKALVEVADYTLKRLY